MNACCGHGNREGYIQFDNGITIRGYFRVEKREKDGDILSCKEVITMQIAGTLSCSLVNGYGVRILVFCQGCSHIARVSK